MMKKQYWIAFLLPAGLWAQRHQDYFGADCSTLTSTIAIVDCNGTTGVDFVFTTLIQGAIFCAIVWVATTVVGAVSGAIHGKKRERNEVSEEQPTTDR